MTENKIQSWLVSKVRYENIRYMSRFFSRWPLHWPNAGALFLRDAVIFRASATPCARLQSSCCRCHESATFQNKTRFRMKSLKKNSIINETDFCCHPILIVEKWSSSWVTNCFVCFIASSSIFSAPEQFAQAMFCRFWGETQKKTLSLIFWDNLKSKQVIYLVQLSPTTSCHRFFF